MIKVYGIKNCDSVKKAISFFKKNNLNYQLHDFKTDPVECDKVSKWLEVIDIKTLFNSRSTTYRTLKLKEMNLTPEEQKQWLCKENLLIKRPVIEYNENLLVGYDETKYQGVFL